MMGLMKSIWSEINDGKSFSFLAISRHLEIIESPIYFGFDDHR